MQPAAACGPAAQPTYATGPFCGPMISDVSDIKLLASSEISRIQRTASNVNTRVKQQPYMPCRRTAWQSLEPALPCSAAPVALPPVTLCQLGCRTTWAASTTSSSRATRCCWTCSALLALTLCTVRSRPRTGRNASCFWGIRLQYCWLPCRALLLDLLSSAWLRAQSWYSAPSFCVLCGQLETEQHPLGHQ